MADLAFKPEVAERRAEVRAFMEEHVYPNEAALAREDESSDALIAELRAKAKDAGIWAPHLPPEAGGSGSGFMEYALLNEEIGRSMWAQLVFNCQAPDAGNGEILHLFGTEEQKERFLKPLVEGDRALVLLDDRARGLRRRPDRPPDDARCSTATSG